MEQFNKTRLRLKPLWWVLLVSATAACILPLAGCLSQATSIPRVVYSPTVMPLPPAPRPKVQIPQTPRQSPKQPQMNVPANWYPPRSLEKQWGAIVVHHSATPNGNLDIFDRWHREGNHWEGVGYDFVIGNGTDSANGQIEVTFRWDQQKVGAHCKTPGNWANEHTIGICLVGDFKHDPPTQRQMASLAKLVRFLCARYRISPDLIYGHNTTPGARVTQCPGVAFPFADLYALLEQ